MALLEGRYIGIDHPILFDELEHLEDVGGKIDHDSDHSKDISDSVAGSLYYAYKSVTDKKIATVNSSSLLSKLKSVNNQQNRTISDLYNNSQFKLDVL